MRLGEDLGVTAGIDKLEPGADHAAMLTGMMSPSVTV